MPPGKDDKPPTFQSFPPTQWSLVGRAGGPSVAEKRRSLEALLTRYLPALRAFLVYRKRLAPDQADDVLQGFVADKVVERDLIAGADRAKGKFRTFLLTALEHYHISQVRKQTARKRAPDGGQIVPLDPGSADDAGGANQAHDPAAPGPGPDHAYDVAWAREVIAEATRRTQAECESGGRPELWGLLQGRILAPATDGAEPAGYEELITRFGLKSPLQVSNLLVTARRMFARNLKAVVAEYAGDAEEVEEEIRDLKAILGGGG